MQRSKGQQDDRVSMDVLWDPGDQRSRPEDHLTGVAALYFLSIDQAAEGQVVGIWQTDRRDIETS